MSISALGSSTASSMFSMDQVRMKRPEDYDSPEDFVSSIVSDNDADGDGKLSIDEAGFLDDHFSEIDSDGDGYLSQEEMVADLKSRQEQKAMMGQMSVMMQSGSESLIDSLMSELDSDGDSLISQHESGLDDELFSVLDTDGDGNLSSQELEESMASMAPSEGMGTTVAASGSGSSQSSSESSDDSDEEYDEFDYNKDGVVSFSELQQAFASGVASLEDVVGKGSDMNGEMSGQEQEEGQSGQSVLQRMAMRAYQGQTGAIYTGDTSGTFV
ncbi:EF-hand domain-containing protein [Maridesulfovibrio sp. FT414]|uniref:EF-hand domain-containing protein n=1 Tax=Maridesulfovibrio sp. FT414 TaxID=2979469 RepID=UPI003D80218A